MSRDPVTTGHTRLLIPGLQPFYDQAVPFSYALIRITAGLMLLPHGIPKLFTQGVGAFAAAGLARRGIEPALPLAWLIVFIETVGGVLLALGLFTRVIAAMVAIEMLVIVSVYWPKFGWTLPGYEYPLMWGLIAFALALGGGGPYSLDRKLGREL
jgi:putative oxidoreductase